MVLAQKEKYASMDQDRTPERSPRTYGQPICDKGGRPHNAGKTVSSTNAAGKTGQPRARK